MRSIDSVSQRYMNSPEFKMLVDHLEAMIHAARMTPQEIREAATYAVIRYELRRPMRPIRMVLGEYVYEEKDHAGEIAATPPEAVLVDGVVYRRE